MDIDSPESSAPTSPLSNQTLQAAKHKREAERQERLKNGNIIPRKQHKVGKRLDDLTHRLVIERKGVTAAGATCTIYYCIGCDEESRNNAHTTLFFTTSVTYHPPKYCHCVVSLCHLEVSV